MIEIAAVLVLLFVAPLVLSWVIAIVVAVVATFKEGGDE